MNLFCLFRDVVNEYLTNKKKTLTLLSVAEKKSLTLLSVVEKENSHTTLTCRKKTSTTLTPSATSITKQLSQKLINFDTYLAAPHCSSHSHTISTVRLHIIMSGKGLLTL